jgi:hypothetical protein
MMIALKMMRRKKKHPRSVPACCAFHSLLHSFPLLFHDSQCECYLQKPETGKRAGSVLKAPASDKKAKIATPSGQKTGEKC